MRYNMLFMSYGNGVFICFVTVSVLYVKCELLKWWYVLGKWKYACQTCMLFSFDIRRHFFPFFFLFIFLFYFCFGSEEGGFCSPIYVLE